MKTIKLYFYGIIAFAYIFIFGVYVQINVFSKIDVTENAKAILRKGGWYES